MEQTKVDCEKREVLPGHLVGQWSFQSGIIPQFQENHIGVQNRFGFSGGLGKQTQCQDGMAAALFSGFVSVDFGGQPFQTDFAFGFQPSLFHRFGTRAHAFLMGGHFSMGPSFDKISKKPSLLIGGGFGLGASQGDYFLNFFFRGENLFIGPHQSDLQVVLGVEMGFLK